MHSFTTVIKMISIAAFSLSLSLSSSFAKTVDPSDPETPVTPVQMECAKKGTDCQRLSINKIDDVIVLAEGDLYTDENGKKVEATKDGILFVTTETAEDGTVTTLIEFIPHNKVGRSENEGYYKCKKGENTVISENSDLPIGTPANDIFGIEEIKDFARLNDCNCLWVPDEIFNELHPEPIPKNDKSGDAIEGEPSEGGGSSQSSASAGQSQSQSQGLFQNQSSSSGSSSGSFSMGGSSFSSSSDSDSLLIEAISILTDETRFGGNTNIDNRVITRDNSVVNIFNNEVVNNNINVDNSFEVHIHFEGCGHIKMSPVPLNFLSKLMPWAKTEEEVNAGRLYIP